MEWVTWHVEGPDDTPVHIVFDHFALRRGPGNGCAIRIVIVVLSNGEDVAAVQEKVPYPVTDKLEGRNTSPIEPAYAPSPPRSRASGRSSERADRTRGVLPAW